MSRLEGMEKQGGPSDAELVSRALEATTLADRKAAYAAIADRHHLAVLRQCAHWFPSRIEAEDVSQTTFEEAFRLLATDKGPPVPDKLIGWLIEIARRRGLRYRSLQARGAGPGRAHLADDQSFDMFEDDQDPRSGSATRLAHVNRLVDTVVATLNGRQQRIYQLRYAEELTGRQVAQRLGIANSTASNAIGEVEKLITNGFGAL